MGCQAYEVPFQSADGGRLALCLACDRGDLHSTASAAKPVPSIPQVCPGQGRRSSVYVSEWPSVAAAGGSWPLASVSPQTSADSLAPPSAEVAGGAVPTS